MPRIEPILFDHTILRANAGKSSHETDMCRPPSPQDSAYGSDPSLTSPPQSPSMPLKPSPTRSVRSPSLPSLPTTSDHLKTMCSEFDASFVVLVKDGHVTRWPATLKDITDRDIAMTCHALSNTLIYGNRDDGRCVCQHAQHFLQRASTRRTDGQADALLRNLKNILRELGPLYTRKHAWRSPSKHSNSSAESSTPQERKIQFQDKIRALQDLAESDQATKIQYLKTNFPAQCSSEKTEDLIFDENEEKILCLLDTKASPADKMASMMMLRRISLKELQDLIDKMAICHILGKGDINGSPLKNATLLLGTACLSEFESHSTTTPGIDLTLATFADSIPHGPADPKDEATKVVGRITKTLITLQREIGGSSLERLIAHMKSFNPSNDYTDHVKFLQMFLKDWLGFQQQLNLNETQNATVRALFQTFMPPIELERLLAEPVSQLSLVLKEVIEQQVKTIYGNKDLKEFHTSDIQFIMGVYNDIIGILQANPRDTSFDAAETFRRSI